MQKYQRTRIRQAKPTFSPVVAPYMAYIGAYTRGKSGARNRDDHALPIRLPRE